MLRSNSNIEFLKACENEATSYDLAENVIQVTTE
jgi:hypothetical protein